VQPGGAHIDVQDHNLEEYLDLVLDFTLGSGISRQVKAFQDGFSTIIPINDIKIFSPEELGLLIGNTDEDWSRESKSQSLLK
jgi:E3 ubiquitin-protein ligase TRIP12